MVKIQDKKILNLQFNLNHKFNFLLKSMKEFLNYLKILITNKKKRKLDKVK